MSVVFDKHRLLSGLALPPTELQEPQAVGRRHNADSVLTIGLVNNMPDAALQATERQFKGLLRAAGVSNIVDLRYFSLPSLRRSPASQSRIERFYTRFTELRCLHIDGLIVTGAEPNSRSVTEESYWPELTDLIDWAAANTRSTIWSCLAAHAAVLHLDGIERQPLSEKCSGMFDCSKTTDDWLVRDIPSPLKVSHSRLNEIKRSDLVARGYRVLTESRQAGVDIFTKRLASYFIFFQGHPEYDLMSLQREYRRDISRFLARERETYPPVPFNYFDSETEHRLVNFEKRARSERKPALIGDFPRLTYRPENVAGTTPARVMFRNWLGYLAGSRRVEQAGNPIYGEEQWQAVALND